MILEINESGKCLDVSETEQRAPSDGPHCKKKGWRFASIRNGVIV